MRAIVLATVLISGCGGGWIETGPAVFGPYPSRPEAELFDEVHDTVEARGYRTIDSDPALGHFAVRSIHRGPDGRATFRFRFYRGGWVGTEIGGAAVRQTRAGRVVIPVSVFEEYSRLVVGLIEGSE